MLARPHGKRKGGASQISAYSAATFGDRPGPISTPPDSRCSQITMSESSKTEGAGGDGAPAAFCVEKGRALPAPVEYEITSSAADLVWDENTDRDGRVPARHCAETSPRRGRRAWEAAKREAD